MTLLFETEGAVATVTLNRPNKLNAINGEMRAEFASAFERIEHDTTIKVVVVAGAGERAFCSGADMDEISGRSGMERRRQIATDPANLVRACSKPVIARLHGYTLGGGLELATSCDIRIAAESTVLGYPEIRHGWLPGGGGGTQTLPRIVGMGQAMIAVLTGRQMTAREALAIRLVDQVHADDALDDAVSQLASDIARNRFDALILAKAALRMTERTDLLTGLQYEKELSTLTYYFEGRAEALQAFTERRKPKSID